MGYKIGVEPIEGILICPSVKGIPINALVLSFKDRPRVFVIRNPLIGVWSSVGMTHDILSHSIQTVINVAI